jgi:6-pyruvoyltetrahydropterin/6-carboxytetrahydropterin synthase
MGNPEDELPNHNPTHQANQLPTQCSTTQDVGDAVTGGRFFVQKTYGAETGLSCCFRQHKATSHCQQLHGYAIGVKLTFTANQFTTQGWVIDFGGLKTVKKMLQSVFDHTTLVAEDDPELDQFKRMADAHLIDLRIVPATGCEAFARMIHDCVASMLEQINPVVNLYSVEVFEHGANSAIYVA